MPKSRHDVCAQPLCQPTTDGVHVWRGWVGKLGVTVAARTVVLLEFTSYLALTAAGGERSHTSYCDGRGVVPCLLPWRAESADRGHSSPPVEDEKRPRSFLRGGQRVV